MSNKNIDSLAGISERIKNIRKSNKLRQDVFSKKIGITQSTLSEIENAKYFPSEASLKLLESEFGINGIWLRTGVGQDQVEIFDQSTKPDQEQSADDYCRIPMYQGQVGACGYGSEGGEEYIGDLVAFRRSWIRHELMINPKDLTLIFVTGDSMTPTVTPGDMVMVDHSACDAITDGVWVLSMGDGPIVKRIQRMSKTRLRVFSDNKVYDPIEIDLTDPPEGLRFIGRVVWSGGRM